MFKNILYIVILLIVSLFISFLKPEMHKQALITDSEYGFIEISAPQEEKPILPSDNTINQNITVSNQQMNTVPMKVEQTKQQTTSLKPNNQQIKTTQPQTKKIKQTPKPTTQATQQTQTKPQTKTPSPQKDIPQQKSINVNPTQNIENKPVKQVLTEEEEIIAWNRWRSRLQNQVMKDANVLAPLGTVFQFSFTVDKYGNMSNVKVWSPNPMYNNYAIRQIKPILMSYRNKPILNFPQGTKRIITNVTGGFTISRTTQYSKPEDYHDFEHIKR